MDVRRMLALHKALDERINLKLDEIAHLRALAERATMRIGGTKGKKGSYSDKVGKYASKIADLEKKIDSEIDRLVTMKERIMDIAASLDDDLERNIIERHYIMHESLTDISEKLGYSLRHITRVHIRALEKLETMYDDGISA